MDLSGKKLVVIGGIGLIGSHTVDALVREDVGEIVILDCFVRSSRDNLAIARIGSRPVSNIPSAALVAR